jgi:hypothetical protein
MDRGSTDIPRAIPRPRYTGAEISLLKCVTVLRCRAPNLASGVAILGPKKSGSGKLRPQIVPSVTRGPDQSRGHRIGRLLQGAGCEMGVALSHFRIRMAQYLLHFVKASSRIH